MTEIPGQEPSERPAMAQIEEQLASAIYKTADEVARSECFDDEQRAEVYSIIETLRADTRAHQAAVKLLCHHIKRGNCDA